MGSLAKSEYNLIIKNVEGISQIPPKNGLTKKKKTFGIGDASCIQQKWNINFQKQSQNYKNQTCIWTNFFQTSLCSCVSGIKQILPSRFNDKIDNLCIKTHTFICK